MNVFFYVKLYLLTIPVFFLIDILWLGVVAKSYYRRQLAGILGQNVNWAAAVTFYVIYIAGIIFFAVRPSIEGQSLGKAALLGAFYGFFTYATYDLTNMATIDGWPLQMAIVDIGWGVFLCLSVSSISHIIATKIL
jgi:uncharacterized membrane protein